MRVRKTAATVALSLVLAGALVVQQAKPAEAFVPVLAPLAMPLVKAGAAIVIGAGASWLANRAGEALSPAVENYLADDWLYQWLSGRDGADDPEFDFGPELNTEGFSWQAEHPGFANDVGSPVASNYFYASGTELVSDLEVSFETFEAAPGGGRSSVRATYTGTAMATGDYYIHSGHIQASYYRGHSAFAGSPYVFGANCNNGVETGGTGALALDSGQSFTHTVWHICDGSGFAYADFDIPWWLNLGGTNSVMIRTGTGQSTSLVATYNTSGEGFSPDFHGGAARKTVVEYGCYDPATDVVTDYGYETTNWEIDPLVGGNMRVAADLCPDGTTPSYLTISSAPVAQHEGDVLPILHWEQDGALLVDTHPMIDCLVSPWLCELKVQRWDSDTSTWADCDIASELCHDWWNVPNRAAMFRCMWGTHELPLSNCFELSRFYNWDTPGAHTPNPHLTAGTGASAPNTTTSLTGTPSDAGETTSLPPAGSTSGTEGGSDPGASTSTTLVPVESPGSGDGCLQTGLVAWNPVTWVYAPVACVLEWAFVPSEATMLQLETLPEAFHGKPPHSVVTGVAGWWDDIRVGAEEPAGCLLIEVPILEEEYRVVDSCTPGPVAAQIMAYRSILAVAVYAFFLAPLAWWAWREYAPGSKGMA